VIDGELSDRRVFADRNALETLLLILLSNALDAIANGGRITIELHNGEDERLGIVIADDGCGIAPGDQTRIFEPFFTTKPIGKGTGLGLAIARNIVAEHGGDITVESEQGKGTRVFVRVPIWQEAMVATP